MSSLDLGGGSDFKDLSKQFEQSTVHQLQSSLHSKQDKKELREAAINAIKKLESEFHGHVTDSQSNRYIEMAEKFAALFPEDKENLTHINDFAHKVIGTGQNFGQVGPTAESKPSKLKILAQRIGSAFRSVFGKIQQAVSRIQNSINSSKIKRSAPESDVDAPYEEFKDEIEKFKHDEIFMTKWDPIKKEDAYPFSDKWSSMLEDNIKDYKEKIINLDELIGVQKEVTAPPKPPGIGKVKSVNFPQMIADVKVLSVSLGGTTGAKLVEANGQKFVKKTGIAGHITAGGGDQAAHVSSEYHTNRVYQALGVPVPATMIYHTTTAASIKGELPSGVNPKDVTSVVMLSEFIESTSWSDYMSDPLIDPEQKERTKEMLRQHFVVDCLLGNYDVMGFERDNIRVTKEGVPYRIDNGSGLENRAQGKLKPPEHWGKTVTEIDSLRNTGHFKQEIRNAAEVYKDVTDDMIRDQVADLVSNKELILASLPERYHAVIEQRLDYLKERFPPVSVLENLPLLTATETIEQLKNQPIGSVLVRRSSDPTTSDQLVVACKINDGGPPFHGVNQEKLLPGSKGKFIYEGKEYKINELVDLFKEKYTPKVTPEQLVAASLKAGVPKHAGEMETLVNNLNEAFQGIGWSNWDDIDAIDFVRANIKPMSAIMNGNLEDVSPEELLAIEDRLDSFNKYPIPKEIKEGVVAIREKYEKQFASETFDPKPIIEKELAAGKVTSPTIDAMIKLGADKEKVVKAAKEIALSKITDSSIDDSQLQNTLRKLDGLVTKASTVKGISFFGGVHEVLVSYRAEITAIETGTGTVSDEKLSEFRTMYNATKNFPLAGIFLDSATKGYKVKLQEASDKFAETLKTADFTVSAMPKVDVPPSISFEELPVLTALQTMLQLADAPVGAVLARRSSDPTTSDQLVIAVRAKDTVHQYKLLPGKKPDTFILPDVGEFTIDQLKDHYSGKTTLTAKPPSPTDHLLQEYKNLQKLSSLSNTPIPESLTKAFTAKVVLPMYQIKSSPALQKVLEGKAHELSLEELSKLPAEIESFGDLPVPEQAGMPKIANAVLNWVDAHKSEIQKDPKLATRAHHILHELAQKEIASGNVRSGFEIEAKAASAIPLSATHPLHKMDEAILQGTALQHDAKTGAFFGSFDTSILKGGNLHAAQRKIDGEMVNTFDFKISHYARDELTTHVDAIINNPEEFKASVPKELAASVTINQNVSQEFLRYDDDKKQYTRAAGYSPGNSTATEIVFEGVGKIIIGNNKKNGSMYNRIQVEINPNLPPGEGAKKLQQMLAVTGMGPVLGEQPPEADERMKIAQLYRAFYPGSSTAMDTTKEFYQLPIDDLKKKIIEEEPGMEAIFEKYLDTNPELMQKVEILPGKEIWGVTDLGAQMKARGAWGLMTGVGNSGGWPSAKTAIVRMLTQGAMSSEQRFESGVFKKGASSEDDLLSGGGDQVFTRLVNNNTGKNYTSTFPFHGSAQILWNLDSVAQRVPYGYDSDKYGVKNRFGGGSAGGTYFDYQHRPSMLEMASNASNSGNEVMVKNSLSPGHVAGVVVSNNNEKDELIQHLVKEGLAEKDSGDGLYYVKFAGKRIKADDFIHVGAKFKKEWWG